MTAAVLSARPGAPLSGTVKVPGDKSISHRALILGAMAVGPTTIEGLLEGEDVLATARAMRAFGATVTRTGEGPGPSTVRAAFASPRTSSTAATPAPGCG